MENLSNHSSATEDQYSEIRKMKEEYYNPKSLKYGSKNEWTYKEMEISRLDNEFYNRFKKPDKRAFSDQDIEEYLLNETVLLHINSDTAKDIIKSYMMTNAALRRVLFIDESILQIDKNIKNLPRQFFKHLPDLPLCSSLGELEYMTGETLNDCFWFFYDTRGTQCEKHTPFVDENKTPAIDYDYFMKELENKIDKGGSSFNTQEEREYRIITLLKTRHWSLCTACQTNINSECEYFEAVRNTMDHVVNIKECLYEWRNDPTPDYKKEVDENAACVSPLIKAYRKRPDRDKPYHKWVTKATYDKWKAAGEVCDVKKR